MEKHSVVITGHQTSLSLEPEFWEALKQIAKRKKKSVSSLIQEIDNTRNRNLSAAVRVFILNELIQEIVKNKQA